MTMIVEERTDVTDVMIESCGMPLDCRVTWVEPFRWQYRKGSWMYEVTALPGSGDVIRPMVPPWSAKGEKLFAERFAQIMAKCAAKEKAKAKRAAKKAAEMPAPRKRRTA